MRKLTEYGLGFRYFALNTDATPSSSEANPNSCRLAPRIEIRKSACQDQRTIRNGFTGVQLSIEPIVSQLFNQVDREQMRNDRNKAFSGIFMLALTQIGIVHRKLLNVDRRAWCNFRSFEFSMIDRVTADAPISQ